MSRSFPRFPLEALFAADAASGLAMGVILAPFAERLAPWLGLPGSLLSWAGLALFPCAALMIAAATVRSLTVPLGWVIVIGNALWVVASLGLLVALPMTGLGAAAVVAQAGFVAVITVLEWQGLASRGAVARAA